MLFQLSYRPLEEKIEAEENALFLGTQRKASCGVAALLAISFANSRRKSHSSNFPPLDDYYLTTGKPSCQEWWVRVESNYRPLPYQRSALNP